MLEYPVQDVFGHLACPARLGDWLPEVSTVADTTAPMFTLRLRCADGVVAASGELIAHEPPSSVAYRLIAGPEVHVLRLTCTATDHGTRLHIHQAGPAHPLTVDLTGLANAIAARPPRRDRGTNTTTD